MDKEIQSAVGQSHPYEVGKNYFIQTVTHYYTGKLVEVLPHELVLEDAAWIADTGRFEQFIKEGTVNEVEPYPAGRLVLGRGSLIQAFQWTHALPRLQK
jgi:hypothetical protein